MQGKLGPAIQDINKEIELNPTDPMNFLNRGSARFLKGEISEASKDFEKCLALGTHR